MKSEENLLRMLSLKFIGKFFRTTLKVTGKQIEVLNYQQQNRKKHIKQKSTLGMKSFLMKQNFFIFYENLQAKNWGKHIKQGKTFVSPFFCVLFMNTWLVCLKNYRQVFFFFHEFPCVENTWTFETSTYCPL